MFMLITFSPEIFALSFSISQAISLKFPELKLLLSFNKNKNVRVHHAIIGGILALIAGITSNPLWFNVTFGAMVQDVVSHVVKFVKKKHDNK